MNVTSLERTSNTNSTDTAHDSDPNQRSNLVKRYATLAGRLCFLALESAEKKTDPDMTAALPDRRPRVERAKRVLTKTHSHNLLLRALTPRHHSIVGGGSENLVVLQSDGTVAKHNFKSVGLPPAELAKLRDTYRSNFSAVQQQFGDIIEPTTYDIEPISVRGLSKRPGIVSHQRYITPKVDALSPLGKHLLSEPAQAQARNDLAGLVTASREWAAQGKWIDLIGKENLLLTPINGEWHLRAIDAQPLTASDLETVHPTSNLTHRDKLELRLDELTLMAQPEDVQAAA